MARIRTIKPEFFTSEDIVSLSPLARLLYISTWCEADKEGRLQWKPYTFKLRYFPAVNCDINALCAEIVNAGLVVLYGDGLAYIPSFAKHQHINPRESTSILPDPHATPPKTTRAPRVATRHDATTTRREEGKGREGDTRVDDATKVRGFPPGFDEFWSAYPRKTAKAEAAKAYARLRPDDELQALMLAAVVRQAATTAWTKDGGEYVPHAATWINGKRWEDGATTATVDRFAGAL